MAFKGSPKGHSAKRLAQRDAYYEQKVEKPRTAVYETLESKFHAMKFAWLNQVNLDPVLGKMPNSRTAAWFICEHINVKNDYDPETGTWCSYPSHELLAALMSVSSRTLVRIMKPLEARGYVEVIRKERDAISADRLRKWPELQVHRPVGKEVDHPTDQLDLLVKTRPTSPRRPTCWRCSQVSSARMRRLVFKLA